MAASRTIEPARIPGSSSFASTEILRSVNCSPQPAPSTTSSSTSHQVLSAGAGRLRAAHAASGG